MGREWGADDDDADDDDDDIIAGIEIEETENGVFVLSSDLVDDNEEESYIGYQCFVWFQNGGDGRVVIIWFW